MKNLQLKSMLLVSHREKKARKIEFDPDITVVQGENDTGKSSVIKSIPYAFGANPHKRHPKWTNADILILIRFSLDGKDYSIYRHRNSFSLFDSDDLEIGTYSSITNELAPELAKLFDFNLKLSDREGVPITPPPAYLMLPFYIDQDKGWVENWSSFTNLSQFSHWKQRVTGYHFGLRPDKWYELEAKRKNLENDKEEPLRQIKSIQSVKDKAYKDVSRVDFNIDAEQFRREINQLLDRCEILKGNENSYRQKISEYKTEKIRLEAQIEIVVRTHDELSEDYKFSTQLNDETIGCPTCGANYSNSFSERFDIAQDTETCSDLLASLRDDLKDIEKKIDDTESLFAQAKETREQINSLLSQKKGEVKLKDLIDLEGKKALITHLENEEGEYRAVITDYDERIHSTTDEMKKYDDPERRKAILSQYEENLRRNTSKLGVHSLSDNVFTNINASIEESGSDLPRAILAYFFAALSAIEKNGNATFFPIIIDAPNQQEQDPKNLQRILEFVRDNRPQGRQLIIGLVEDANIDFGGKVLLFDKKYSVLNEDDYGPVANEIRQFEAANLAVE